MKVKILVSMQQTCPSALDKILNQEIESIDITLSSQEAILPSADYFGVPTSFWKTWRTCKITKKVPCMEKSWHLKNPE